MNALTGIGRSTSPLLIEEDVILRLRARHESRFPAIDALRVQMGQQNRGEILVHQVI